MTGNSGIEVGEQVGPINGFTIDCFGDTPPPHGQEPYRDLTIIGDHHYDFDGQPGAFAPRVKPNVRLQVFNIVLGMIVEGQGETITPGEASELIDPTRQSVDAVRVAMRSLRRVGLLSETDQRRRRTHWRALPELIVQAPTNVVVKYKPYVAPGIVLKPPKPKGRPTIPEELLRELPVPTQDPTLSGQAACANEDQDLFYPRRGQSTEPAKTLCNGCPEKMPCLAYALKRGYQAGVFGATSARERREIIRLRRALKATNQ